MTARHRISKNKVRSFLTVIGGEGIFPTERSRWGRSGIVLLLLGQIALAGGAEELPAPTITNPALVWSMPTDQKSRTYPLRIEGRISYYDPSFKLLWIERDNVSVYVQLASDPPALRTGQYVVIEGKITPTKGLSAEDAMVRVVQENAPVTPLETKDRINDRTTLQDRVVVTEGYVDTQQLIDEQHVRLVVIVENRPVICWVKPDDAARVPDWRDHLVRVTGLYSSRFDLTQTRTTIECWVGRQDGVQVLGTLDNKAGFNRSPTPISELNRIPAGTEVRVRGQSKTHTAGSAMTIRDETGQVEIRSIQQQLLPADAEVEAVGQVAVSSGQTVIDAALYRPVPGVASEAKGSLAANANLKTVAEVRALSAADAALGREVDVKGMVTWSHSDANFLFLQDLTGGIRVYYDRIKTGTIPFGKYFEIKGVTRAGPVAPAIELRDFTDLGSMSHPKAKQLTLEQALTGAEEGEWVELRGFVQDTVSDGNWRWIHVTTPAGDFSGHLDSPVNFAGNSGSLVRLHGVCETNVDADGRITGITLRIPFLHDIVIEEDAPADYFDLPRRALEDLKQIGAGQSMLRVRVTGTVQYAVPGQSVYLEEGNTGLLLLSRETQPLQPGDQIEAVGILGREGARTILRQGVYRKTGTGPAPNPMILPDKQPLTAATDSRLVRLRGTLIDVFRRTEGTRLTLQQGNRLFDAMLDQPAGAAGLDLAVGAGLELTGIYKLVFDDSGQPRAFRLQLRTPRDVRVYAPARLWTVQRALSVAAVLAGFVMLGLAWIRALRKQVARQTAQIRNQMEQQVRLEAEVQRAARLQSLGVLAGGIAHDYNNLLTVIMGNLSLMKFNSQIMELEGKRVSDIEQAAFRARDLTRELLTFAEGNEPLRAVVDLAEIVREAAESAVSGTNVSCRYEIAPDLRPVRVDKEQIAQVVQNLARNAVQAMPEGGAMRIVLANADIEGDFHALKPGPCVRLTVIDAGEGIPRGALPRIFDPFFTTKKKGTGLGLATVYSIVKKHRGHIEVQSQEGQGAVFTVWLPVVENANGTEPAGPAEIIPPAATGATMARVLLMDDDDSVRQLGATLLHRMGLEPIAVSDGAGALREFEAAQNAGRPFSLLIFDLTIPGGMGGKATIEAIRKTGANVPAIVSSGYSRDPVMANFREHGFQAVVPKPYEIDKLMETITRLLATQRSG